MASHFEKLDTNIQMGWLLDFYSSLLTDRQRYVLEQYYNEDLSLAEIADILGVSRQNIHDIIARASSKLLDYEHKLNLVDRTLESNSKLNNVLSMLDKGNLSTNELKQVEQSIRQAIQYIEEA